MTSGGFRMRRNTPGGGAGVGVWVIGAAGRNELRELCRGDLACLA